jgi:hypothetical protein
MTHREILDFVKKSENDRINLFYNSLYEKQKELNRRFNRTSFQLLTIVTIYFIASNYKLQPIQIGPLSLSDLRIILILLPVAFSYFFLELAVISEYRAENYKMLRWITLLLYNPNLKDSELQNPKFFHFTRLVLPFSFWYEIIWGILKKNKRKIHWFTVLIFSPIFLLAVAPFWFEYLAIMNVITHYWDENIAKFSVIASMWLSIIGLYYYLKTIFISDTRTFTS